MIPRIRIHGPRGAALLGLGVVCVAMGLFYVGPFALPQPQALDSLSAVMPLSLWGVLWCMNGSFLVGAAFKMDQARALGFTTGLFAVWGINYSIAFVEQMVAQGESRYWLSAVIYLGFVVCLMGLARMVNPGPVHVEIVKKAGPPLGGDDYAGG